MGYFSAKAIHVVDQSPRDGERVKDIPHEISARVIDLEHILPETAQILVDKLGGHWRPVSIDPKTGVHAFPDSADRYQADRILFCEPRG